MGLFDKKYCSVCGEKIGFLGGMLGIRDLEDGHLCKECAEKLSPFFNEKKHSTVAEIKEQLAYREENKKEVAAFHATRVYGDYKKLYLDEDARKLMMASGSNLAAANPDVISFDQVIGCRLDIDESRSEEKQDGEDGKKISYNPPRYTYSYDFEIEFTVKHPYFSGFTFPLESNVEIHSIGTGLVTILQANDANYQRCLKLGNEICSFFDKQHADSREEAAAANAPKTARVCPACGATTMPDAHGCCEYCGSPISK